MIEIIGSCFSKYRHEFLIKLLHSWNSMRFKTATWWRKYWNYKTHETFYWRNEVVCNMFVLNPSHHLTYSEFSFQKASYIWSPINLTIRYRYDKHIPKFLLWSLTTKQAVVINEWLRRHTKPFWEIRCSYKNLIELLT